jgi:hypothetical protein
MLYFTKWAFRVEKVLKGDKVKELIIGQSGSPNQPGTDDRDDPLFLPGEQYLLFLNGDSSGVYHNFGPQGRYLIWENKVYSMNYILLPEAQYKPPPELDFNGVELDTIADDINKIVDSVHLRFTKGRSGLQADLLRYSAGTTLDINAILLTGKNGPGEFTYTIDTVTLPEGMEVSISPVQFTAYPENEYKSTLLIMITPEVTPGSYQITVGYDFEGVGTGNRTINLNVNPYEVPQTE